jgi:hypothetical protein
MNKVRVVTIFSFIFYRWFELVQLTSFAAWKLSSNKKLVPHDFSSVLCDVRHLIIIRPGIIIVLENKPDFLVKRQKVFGLKVFYFLVAFRLSLSLSSQWSIGGNQEYRDVSIVA